MTVAPITSEEFAEWRKPRFGDTNPTRLDNPLWASLVHDRINAWQVAKRFGFERFPGAGPTWCFDRFGQTTTVLADGRTIYIGGEHEDYYDPDFYIYNDVVIVAPNGDVAIYGYPRDVFPPTDFHSATLFGDAIVIVGSLGYQDARTVGATPVYRLVLATKAIESITTTGESPGWIRQMLWGDEHSDFKGSVDYRADLIEAIGREPDLDVLRGMYLVDDATRLLEKGDDDDYNVYRIEIDGVIVVFKEDSYRITALVEGRLSDARLSDVQAHVQYALSELHNALWQLRTS